MVINILVDNPQSWILPYAERLCDILKKEHRVNFIFKQEDIKTGDLAFFLGCVKLVSKEILERNKHNLVVHESNLPLGKGWSPLTWQILEGNNIVPVTLFEAKEEMDSGDIYFQEYINFGGHELVDELRQQQGEKTIELIRKFVNAYPNNITGKKQTGGNSFYRRRKSEDSELDVNKTIAEQFNLLRVVDNERYPAFFKIKDHIYFLKIYKKI